MNEQENKCQHPEKLKGKPGECSPQQIQECHGKGKEINCICQTEVKVINCTCEQEDN